MGCLGSPLHHWVTLMINRPQVQQQKNFFFSLFIDFHASPFKFSKQSFNLFFLQIWSLFFLLLFFLFEIIYKIDVFFNFIIFQLFHMSNLVSIFLLFILFDIILHFKFVLRFYLLQAFFIKLDPHYFGCYFILLQKIFPIQFFFF